MRNITFIVIVLGVHVYPKKHNSLQHESEKLFTLVKNIQYMYRAAKENKPYFQKANIDLSY